MNLASLSVPPTIDDDSVSDRNLSVITQRPIVIDCPVTGVPTPTITWYKDGVEIFADNDPGLRILSGGRRLEIMEADLMDTGSYKCVPKNPAGETERDFHLNVWGKNIQICNLASLSYVNLCVY